MAYRLYELISPYHYNVRLLDIDFTEPKGGKVKSYKLKGFFIEDIDKLRTAVMVNKLKGLYTHYNRMTFVPLETIFSSL